MLPALILIPTATLKRSIKLGGAEYVNKENEFNLPTIPTHKPQNRLDKPTVKPAPNNDKPRQRQK